MKTRLTSILKLHKKSFFVILILLLTSSVASATDFITDVKVIGGGAMSNILNLQ